MTDLDRVLRSAAADVHRDVRDAVDLEADLAATLRRASDEATTVATIAASRTAQRSSTVLRVAAVGLLAVVAVGAALWARQGDSNQRFVASPTPTDASDVVSPDDPVTVPMTTAPDLVAVPTTAPDAAAVPPPADDPVDPTVPMTTAPPTTTEPAPTTSVEGDLDLLAFWPAPADEPAGPLPLLLPSAPIPGAASAVRTEFDEDGTPARTYTQTWHAPDGTTLQITTNIVGLPITPEFARIDTVVEPWDDAFFSVSEDGYSLLHLTEDLGSVTVWAFGLGNDVVDAAARSLTPRAGVPGWDVGELPSSLVAFDEGWHGDATVGDVYWLDAGGSTVAQLTIVRGHRSLFEQARTPSTVVELTDIGGTPAVLVEDHGRSTVVWSPADDVDIRLTLVGAGDDALALARSIGEVDEATWAAASVRDDNANEGCALDLHC